MSALNPEVSAPPNERGTALLTVLLLVAVMSVLAAVMLDRLSIATRLAANGQALAQARLYAVAAETLATDQVKALVDLDRSRTTNETGWVGREVSLPFEDGLARVRVNDGGNCFNLNSVVTGSDGTYLPRSTGQKQFVALMGALGIDYREAAIVSESLADWIDSNQRPSSGGAEDSYYMGLDMPYRTADRLLMDKSELRAVRGVSAESYTRLRPFICALPTTDLSPLNVNTLTADQAPLLVMLSPRFIDAERARQIITTRPQAGYSSTVEFWRPFAAQSQSPGPEVETQVQVRSRWFRLDILVELGEAELNERALIDAQLTPARLVQRQYGEDL